MSPQPDQLFVVKTGSPRAYVATTVTTIGWQKERVMDTVAAPERNAVGVIVEDATKTVTALDVFGVVGVEADEQERGLRWISTLERLTREVRLKLTAGVRAVHGDA